MNWKHVLVAVLASLGVALATPAGAQPPSSSPGLKNRACVALCRGDRRSCHRTAQQNFQTCAQTTCGTLIAAAHAACDADQTSDACQAATQAAETCLQPCRNTLIAALQGCQGDRANCFSQCPGRQPPPSPGPKDGACMSTCAGKLGDCLTAARGEAQACRDKCGPAIDAINQACSTGGHSQACQAAQVAAHQCLSSCGDALRTAMAECAGTHDDCMNACSSASPTPTPTPTPTSGQS